MSNQDFDFTAVPDPANIISMAQRAAVGNVATSVDDNPDDAAQALKISGATGAPASVVYSDLDHHEAQLKARLSSAIVSANPLLQSYVNSHPMAAKVSNDDYGQLDAISQVLRKVAPGQGYDGSILQAAVKGFKDNYDYENTEAEFGRYKDWLAQNPLFGNFAVRQAAEAGGAALLGANQLAAGTIGGAASGISQLYKNLGGSQVEADKLMRDLIVFAQVGMAEPMATPEGMLHPEVRKSIDEAHQFANAVGPYLHAGQVPPVGVHPLIDEVHVEQAKMDAKNLADALKEATKSSTRERSPEMFGNFVKGITDGDIGIAPDAIRKLYGDKPPAIGDGVLGDVVPDLDAKLQAAEATGSDVKVPLADWLAKVEPEVAKELQDHIRARPEGLTVEEGKELPKVEQPSNGSTNPDRLWYQGIPPDQAGLPQRSEYWTSNLGKAKAYSRYANGVVRIAREADLPPDAIARMDGDVTTSLRLGESGKPATVQQVRVLRELPRTASEEEFLGTSVASNLRKVAGLEPRLEPLEGQPTTKAKQLELPEAGTTRIEDREAFAKASAIGMTVDQYKRYQALIEKRASEDAEAAKSRAMEYQRKTQTAEWKANRAELRPQVRDDLLSRPEHEFDQMLREGKVKLARDGITPEQAAALPKSYLAKDGIHPDDLAGLFGDSSGSDTVGRLVNLHAARGDMQPGEFFKSLVDAETDRQMELRYGNLDKSILEEAKDQVLSETQEQLLHEETLARAAEAGLEYSIGKEELKGAIKDFFDRQLVRDVSSDSALADAGRAGRAAEMALLKGDAAEAFRQKQRQYNAVVMANYARKFEKEQGRFDKLAKRFSARSLDAVDQEYTNWVHDILMRVGKPVKRSVQDLADAVDRGEQKTLTDFVDFKELHDMREVPVAEFLQDPGFRKDYASLTTAEAQAVHDSVKALAKNGRDEQKIIKAGEEYDLNQTKATMINQLAEFKEKHYDAAGGRWLGPLPPSVARPLRTYMVSHLQLESIFNRWDRGDPRGVFTQFIARELATAANSEAALEREFAGKLREVADKGDLKARVPNDLFKDPLGGEPIAMTRKNLRAILLNVGNKSNFDKLARGYIGSIGKGEEGKAQVAAFQGDIMMWLHQHATKEDWDWAQGIGDTFAGIKSKSDVMYRSLTGGVEPENIRLSPIQTPHGEYPGWYYPVIYHPVWEGASKKLMGGDPLEQNNYIRATTPAGYTKQRTGYAAPLALDLDMMPVRMRQMLHDIAFRPAVIQAGKIFYDKDVRSAITKHYGTEYTKMLVPYLKDVANSANYRNDAQQVFSRFSEVIRQNIIATLVGLNPGTVLKHGPTAAVNSVTEVGLSNFLKAAKGLFSINDATGETNWGFAMKTSEELQRRHRFYRETLGGAADELGDTSSLRDTMIKLGSYPVAMSDLLSAVPTWMAKYESEMADHGVHGDAVFEADRAVRRAHGSSVITNRPQVMRTGAMGSWLASLYGFFNHIMNRQYELAWRAGDTLDLVKQGEYSNAMSQVPKLSGMLFSYVIFPAIVEELVTPMQDKKGESWGLKAAKSLGYTVSASWIGIRDLVSAAVSGRDPSIGLLSTAYKTVTDTIRDLNKDRPMSKRNAGALLQHSATTLGAATGWTNASEGKAGRFLLDYANGQEHPKGPWGWMTGLRYGTLKNHSPTFQRYLEGR